MPNKDKLIRELIYERTQMSNVINTIIWLNDNDLFDMDLVSMGCFSRSEVEAAFIMMSDDDMVNALKKMDAIMFNVDCEEAYEYWTENGIHKGTRDEEYCELFEDEWDFIDIINEFFKAINIARENKEFFSAEDEHFFDVLDIIYLEMN